jgi:hypothetical protein
MCTTSLQTEPKVHPDDAANTGWEFAVRMSSLDDAVAALKECGIHHLTFGYSEAWGGEYVRDGQASFRLFVNRDLIDGDIVVDGVEAGALAFMSWNEPVARMLARDPKCRFTLVRGGKRVLS